MSTLHLGRLERVELRHVWTFEATGFTPWLANEENLRLLGAAIGIDLELEAQERKVGPFRADILCKDTANDHWVLIENQIERTDHMHLGQLMTYAAGLDAVTIVWIAATFTEEHRAALDWLNRITDDRFSFFGVEVELWKIGESAIAPKFNIVSKPNDWSRKVSASAHQVESEGITEKKAQQLAFWTAFSTFASQSKVIRPVKPRPQHWMPLALGRSGCHLSAIASFYNSQTGSYDTNEVRAEVVLQDDDSKRVFAALQTEKQQIEAEIGRPLVWHNPQDAQMARIYLRRDADLSNQNDWPEQHKWLLSALESLHRAFSARLRSM